MEKTLRNSEKSHRFKRWFARRIITFTCVCTFLAFVNRITTPGHWWVLWVIAGWGMGLVLSLAYYLFDCDDERDYDNC